MSDGHSSGFSSAGGTDARPSVTWAQSKPRVFLSSTIRDLKDLREALGKGVEALGYSVMASERPDFVGEKDLHNHDVCLANVQQADVFVLIVDEKVGSFYEGTAYPSYRGKTITQAEYEHALEHVPEIHVLVRQRTAASLKYFQATYEHDKAVAEKSAHDAGFDPALFAFLAYVYSRTNNNWICEFANVTDAITVLSQRLEAYYEKAATEFAKDVASLLRLSGYRIENGTEVVRPSWYVAETGDREQPFRVAIHCCFRRARDLVEAAYLGRLLASYPECHADRALIITNTGYSESPGIPDSLRGKVRMTTRQSLLDRLLKLGDYTERVKAVYEKGPSEAPFYFGLRFDLKRHYVPLSCESTYYSGELSKAFEKFLADPKTNHLIILSDFGTGKSCSMMELTYRMLLGNDGRIPLFIPLGSFREIRSLQAVVTEALCTWYGLPPFHFSAFLRLLEEGRLLLIFDAFDELARRSELHDTLDSFYRLNEALRGRSKVILTCRDNFFKDREALQELASDERFAIVHLRPFDQNQIRDFVHRHIVDPAKAAWYLDQIGVLQGLHELATRPVLLEMILKVLPVLIKDQKPANIATLYQEFTDRWMKDVVKGGGVLRASEKIRFTEWLALHLFEAGKSRLHHHDLEKRVDDFFRPRMVSLRDLGLLDEEIRTCDFLNCDREGHYQFVHESFKEFFVARWAERCVRDKRADELRRNSLSEEILSFLAQLVVSDAEALGTLCDWAFDEVGTLAWNAIGVFPFLKGLGFQTDHVVGQLVVRCREKGIKRGVAWVLGELCHDTRTTEVRDLLRQALRSPNDASAWWQAAFSLQKMGEISDPVGAMAETLPLDWTPDLAINHLRKCVAATDPDGDIVDERDIVAIVQGYRGGRLRGADIMAVVDQVKIDSDRGFLRSYFAVWLLGELRDPSAITRLVAGARHPSASVRNAAAHALGKVGRFTGTKEETLVLAALAQLLKDPYYRARLHAAWTVGEVGIISLLPQLKTAFAREGLRDVRQAMKEAVMKLETLPSGNAP